MTWWAVDVRAEPERRDAVAAWLVQRTGHAVEERDDGMLVGFAATDTDALTLESDLHGAFAPLDVSRRGLESVDWSTRWREGLGPRRVGRLTIVPSWLASPDPDELSITLDPEMAFGSGEHGSTRGALLLLDWFVGPGDRVLDLGTGSAILAIAAARLGARQVVAIEVDAEAIPVASRNVERNGVSGVVQVLEGDVFALAPLCAPVDVVLSNILRTPNTELLPVIGGVLVPGGVVICAGMERPEAQLFRPVLEAAGFRLLDEVLDEGWWAVAATRT